MATTADRLTTALADRYRIERVLGKGGMATVYLARDARHDRDVAIKVLNAELAESLGRQRFVREIRMAAKLNHPHILPLYDSGEARPEGPSGPEGSSFLYFVMPVMQGQTLRDRLEAERTLPVDEAVRIATEVADALDYAHRQDVVHRDIKPENILLHEGHAVVADFGIGKAIVAAAAESSTFTQVGVTVGTPAYMSPEQATGDELDGRSDLFALGCVLYEMLTGEVAFSGASAQATIARRFLYSPPRVTEKRSDVSDDVAELVTRLLEKAPADRYASGAQVVSTLRAATTSGPRAITPRPDAPSTDKTIAVLPFANMSADADNEFFSDGLTEELITDLSGVRALRVTSRNGMLVSVAEWFAGRAGNKFEAIEGAVAMDPQNPIIHWALGYTYALAGRIAEAAKQASWMLEHAPQASYTTQLVSLVGAIAGHRDEALKALGRLDAAPLDAHQTFHFAESFAMAGDTRKALELFEWAVDHGFYPYRFFAEWCPFIAPLRGMPEFDRIVAKAARRVAEFNA